VTTNALRIVRSLGIEPLTLEYEWSDEDLSAASAADKIGLDLDRVFKTIVLRGPRVGPFVCVVPGSAEVDLRKAAKAVGDKSAEPLPLRELEPLTGYRRGGCSPVGLKRPLPVFIDETATLWDAIAVSAGSRGLQMLLPPADLARASGASFADLV